MPSFRTAWWSDQGHKAKKEDITTPVKDVLTQLKPYVGHICGESFLRIVDVAFKGLPDYCGRPSLSHTQNRRLRSFDRSPPLP